LPIIAKIKAGGQKATEEQLEEILQARRDRWEATRPVRRSRACATCGAAASAQMLQCSTCKTVPYCSRDCQREHWRTHKAKCQRRRTVNICVLSDFA